MKLSSDELENRFSYEFRSWKSTAGFDPVECLASEDNSECYEMNAMHVFKLKDGKYATVHESGCSCYEAADANIDILPDLSSVRESLKNIVGYGYSSGDLAKMVLAALMGVK